jgi:tryptophan synthase alpha chain
MTNRADRGRRYATMFTRVAEQHAGAFIPFLMLGDPDAARNLAQLRDLIAGGADALELGLPFSDPIADGPVIQAAATRALKAGIRRADCWSIVSAIRAENPDLPIGLLVYANLVFHRDPEEFYGAAARAGVDSVLVADLPVHESAAACRAAHAAGVASVFIAPPNADATRLRAIAEASEGYTYVTSREGVTGSDERPRWNSQELIQRLITLGAPPAVIGFGISTPDQVRAALAMGAAGAISGSAVVQAATAGTDLRAFVREMKAATRH